MRKGFPVWFAAVGLASSVWGQATPLDPVEFQVNSYTSGTQFVEGIARQPRGGFVVAWTSDGSAGTDVSGRSVQARLFDEGGRPVGSDFQVNTYTTEDQFARAAATDGDGNFVVVWTSLGSWGNDGFSVQARRFRADGVALDPTEFQLNAYTTGGSGNVAVAGDAEGNFVAAWTCEGSPGNDDQGFSIQARRFAASGEPLDAIEFQVNAYTTYSQTGPSVAATPGGGFVVAWVSNGSFGDDDYYGSIQARRFDAGGNPVDPVEFQVNAFTPGEQANPRVAVAPDGGFVVVWQSEFSPGDDWIGVLARRFRADGSPLDPIEFQVNVFTPWAQDVPQLAMSAAGDFLVTWASVFSAGSDQDGSIQARRFRADGTPVDPLEFPVNTYTTDQQIFPRVAAGADGDFVVAWTSWGPPGGDPDRSVQARRFGRPTIAVTSSSGGTGGPGCTLRDAIGAANAGTSVGDCPAGNEGAVIELPAGATVALTEIDNGSNALPLVERSVTIRGEGARIERDPGLACPVGPEFRLLEVADGGVLTLEDVSVSNGCLSAEPGGGVLVGGGTLVLREASIEGNETGADGGGVALVGGNLIALDSTVRGNLASGGGGGISISGAPDLLLVSGSTLSENEAEVGGGLHLASATPMLVRNSIFSGNVAQASGGGIEVDAAGAELVLDFVTVTDNGAPLGAGAHVENGELSLHGSLVGENSGGADCAVGAGGVTASGMNLDTDASCAALAGGNVATVGVLELAPLGDWGGPTRTHLPLEGSPVLDAAPACATRSGAAIAADQRGFHRPTDDDGDLVPECDLGAVERGLIFADGFASGDSSSWSLTVP